MTAVSVSDNRAWRHFDHQVIAGPAETVRALAVLSASRFPVALVGKVGQVRVAFRSANDHAAAVAAVSPVWAAARRVFFAPEAEAAITTSPTLHENHDAINEHEALSEHAHQPLAGAGVVSAGKTLIRRPPWSNLTFPAIKE
jgi:hypothetical protein